MLKTPMEDATPNEKYIEYHEYLNADENASKALGPDGIPGRIWVRSLDSLGDCMGRLFTKCLRQGAFPQLWKRAKLVLLPKAGYACWTR